MSNTKPNAFSRAWLKFWLNPDPPMLDHQGTGRPEDFQMIQALTSQVKERAGALVGEQNFKWRLARIARSSPSFFS